MSGREKEPPEITLHFTPDELGLVCAALDSHVYWELSDGGHRNSGYVESPGSDDEETTAMISQAEALQLRLWEALRLPEAAKAKRMGGR